MLVVRYSHLFVVDAASGEVLAPCGIAAAGVLQRPAVSLGSNCGRKAALKLRTRAGVCLRASKRADRQQRPRPRDA